MTQQNDTLHPPPGQIGLYVHIPFCHTKCPYCDFNTYSGIESLIPGYVRALEREIRCWGALLGAQQVNTIFFGGGTPSYVPRQAIADVLEAVHGAFRIAADAEVTMEANPGDLIDGQVSSLRQAGVNRLSIGVQSLDDALLSFLGRRHSAQEAVAAYRKARRDGFDNVSLDFMYGIAHQSLEQWRDTLEQALELSPEHLSLYCLTLEGGTPMERQTRLGEIPEADPDLAADMYLLAEDMLAQAGYRHYEISNWAKPGMESRHNLTYWLNRPYLGVGPGARTPTWGSGGVLANMHLARGSLEHHLAAGVHRPPGQGGSATGPRRRPVLRGHRRNSLRWLRRGHRQAAGDGGDHDAWDEAERRSAPAGLLRQVPRERYFGVR